MVQLYLVGIVFVCVDDYVLVVFFMLDFWVMEVVYIWWGVDYYFLVFKVDFVVVGGQILYLIQIGFVVRIVVEFMFGVNQCQGIVIDYC